MKRIMILTATVMALGLATSALVQTNGIFGQEPPGAEPVKFLPGVLTAEKHPHGQLAFSPDGRAVFWSAMLEDGPDQTIFTSAFDGREVSPPMKAPFAATGNGGPAFSPDGRRLYFSAILPPAEGRNDKPTAIFYVEQTGSGWTEPKLVEGTLDATMTKGQVSVARSGNIYFSGRIYSERTPNIFVCRFSVGKHLPPEKLGGPLAEAGLTVDPWVDPDERFLLLSCAPPEGPPMLTDIGISFRLEDGAWSKPERLGTAVNTPAFERFPALSRDGRYFFFIRSLSESFVGDQAHFYWVDADILADVMKKADVK